MWYQMVAIFESGCKKLVNQRVTSEKWRFWKNRAVWFTVLYSMIQKRLNIMFPKSQVIIGNSNNKYKLKIMKEKHFYIKCKWEKIWTITVKNNCWKAMNTPWENNRWARSFSLETFVEKLESGEKDRVELRLQL